MPRDIVVALTAQVGARLAARLVSAPSRMYGIAAAYPKPSLITLAIFGRELLVLQPDFVT
jgi:hypothetical protein